MTRGNQRDTDRAKAQKKANSAVRQPYVPFGVSRSLFATEIKEHHVRNPVPKVQGGCGDYHA